MHYQEIIHFTLKKKKSTKKQISARGNNETP